MFAIHSHFNDDDGGGGAVAAAAASIIIIIIIIFHYGFCLTQDDKQPYSGSDHEQREQQATDKKNDLKRVSCILIFRHFWASFGNHIMFFMFSQ